MSDETPAVRQLIDFGLGVGEGPAWDDRLDCLWFIDILAPALFRLDPPTLAIERYDMPATIGSFGLCEDGRLVVALRSGVHLFDPDTQSFEFLVHPEPDKPFNRLNDGKIGPDGCFWVGSMNDTPERPATGALYRVTPAGDCTKMVDGLTVSNGLAWSADGRTMFHSDSRQRFVAGYDFDPVSGAISNKRLLRTMTEAEGRPDGAAADADGNYWSAGVSAGRLNCLSPDGTLLRQVAMPCPSPTMPCFGGKDLRTLYVTSLGPNGNPAGSLFELDIGVAGAPVGRFGTPA